MRDDSGNRPLEYGRAWIEIDLDALAHNANELRSMLPKGCELMAVVKSDAYGHGAEQVAWRLQREGVGAFAVVSAAEGVRLRGQGVGGDILVLGYTHAGDAGFLSEYDLLQLVADGAHAKSLNESGHALRVHVAIDTGMHRLGVEPANFDEIEGIFKCENLKVEGVATHFASADGRSCADVEFTNLQMERFCALVGALKGKGYDVGRLHTQASYGFLNYPGIECDYARMGIALYGMLSVDGETVAKPSLRPVMSVRAYVAQVRDVGAGESVSYGRIYTTDRPAKLATVSIGYADGVPRAMSGNGGFCAVHGRKAPIVGRICMDLMMIDVTGIDSVAAGDVVTVIGRDGDETIRCEDIAAASGTITNEVACRFGGRLPKVYIEQRSV